MHAHTHTCTKKQKRSTEYLSQCALKKHVRYRNWKSTGEVNFRNETYRLDVKVYHYIISQSCLPSLDSAQGFKSTRLWRLQTASSRSTATCSLFMCCKSRVASSLALPKRDLPKMFLVSHRLPLSDIPTYESSITSKINKQTAYIALTLDEPCPTLNSS